jgi:hypothetical protein
MIPSEIEDWEEFLRDNGCDNIINYGEWISFNCVFHKQTDFSRPSCGIYKETGFVNCFGCGQHTWEELCEAFGISAEDFIEGIRESTWRRFKKKIFGEKEKRKYKRYKLPHQLVNPYGDRDCIRYFNERGLRKSVLEMYHIRLCKEKHSKYNNYLTFPIYDEKGILFFDARYIRDDNEHVRWRRPKDSAIWKTYFNYENIKDEEVLMFVEGAPDALKMIQFGYPAIPAKSFSPFQLNRFWKSKLKYIITLYDNDEAGRTKVNKYGFPIHFTAKAKHLFSNCGIRIIDAKLPDYAKDPANVKYDRDLIKCNPILNEIFV